MTNSIQKSTLGLKYWNVRMGFYSLLHNDKFENEYKILEISILQNQIQEKTDVSHNFISICYLHQGLGNSLLIIFLLLINSN